MAPQLFAVCLVAILGAGPSTQPSSQKPVAKTLRADAPENVKTYLAKCLERKPGEIAETKAIVEREQKRLEVIRRGLIDKAQVETISEAGASFPDFKAKQKAIAEEQDVLKRLRSKLEGLNAGSVLPVVELEFPLKAGRIGWLRGFRVSKILGPNECLAHPIGTVEHYVKAQTRRGRGYWSSATDAMKDVLVQVEMPTSAMVDGRDVEVKTVFEVFGTSTTDEKATVFKLRPFRLDQYLGDAK